MSAVSHSKHVCCFTQQTCLLCHTADISAFLRSRHCLLCRTADVSAVSHRRHVCCVKQQTCLLCDTADMSAASHSRHDCCVAQQISAVSHSRHVCCVGQQTCRKRHKCKHGPPLHAQCKHNTTMNEGTADKLRRQGGQPGKTRKLSATSPGLVGRRLDPTPLGLSVFQGAV